MAGEDCVVFDKFIKLLHPREGEQLSKGRLMRWNGFQNGTWIRRLQMRKGNSTSSMPPFLLPPDSQHA
ncbi:unnamed protein product, partial [Nesidiocoris tenuis]